VFMEARCVANRRFSTGSPPQYRTSQGSTKTMLTHLLRQHLTEDENLGPAVEPEDARIFLSTKTAASFAPEDIYTEFATAERVRRRKFDHTTQQRLPGMYEHEPGPLNSIDDMVVRYSAFEKELITLKKENKELQEALVQHRAAEEAWKKQRDDLHNQLRERRVTDSFGDALRSRVATLALMQPEDVDGILQELDRTIAEELCRQQNELEN
jgi:hypothetical protein